MLKFSVRLAWITLVSIFLVVIAGGVVRMTGSGMGCPDWPKCFDCYIPPTDVSQLPENYKQIYSEKRKEKLHRFADFLTSLGFEKKAQELLADKSLLEEQDFNAFNTWTEYINRLTGALAGLFILAQMILAFAQFKKRKLLAILTFVLLLITLFQAWFGAMVVATNIVPWVLTVHMLLALVMIIIQLHILNLVREKKFTSSNKTLFWLALAGVVIMVLQTLWGTQVRQQIDMLAKVSERSSWMDQLEGIFYVHRSTAIALILLGVSIVYVARKHNIHQKHAYLLVGIILAEALTGKLFDLLGMPAALQPTHLLLSLLLFATMYSLFLQNLKR
ncbi:COX15/CtaA family protein [Parvicella tangerina]|uniref:Heme A synthase n=1 Tax=Parvicella tangerina TaxID=2829795 RepID=A0A916JKT8_9FLAO|nr:COX15/CtaA family protein [Parvicella tangerina]CAG5078214.1 Heme A synthase [Parvicella tangerina]